LAVEPSDDEKNLETTGLMNDAAMCPALAIEWPQSFLRDLVL